MRKKEILSEDDMLVYGAYARVAHTLQHSNRIQLIYKEATITWVIATYIGIGYSVSSREAALPLGPWATVPLICLASLLVVLSIWFLDLVVEEKKIASSVNYGIGLEDQHPKILPKPYHNVKKMNYLLGYVSMKSIFYIGFSSILLLTICGTIASFLFMEGFKYWWISPLISLTIIPFLFLLSNWITKKADPYTFLNHKSFKE